MYESLYFNKHVETCVHVHVPLLYSVHVPLLYIHVLCTAVLLATPKLDSITTTSLTVE